MIFDLASDTGVFVNDQKVVTQKLADRDQLVIGRHRLVFYLEDFQRGKDKTREAGGKTLYLNPDEDLAPLNLEDEGK